MDSVVEGLFSEPVSCQPEFGLVGVPACEREHSPDCFQGCLHTVSGYVFDQDLRVRVASPAHRI